MDEEAETGFKKFMSNYIHKVIETNSKKGNFQGVFLHLVIFID